MEQYMDTLGRERFLALEESLRMVPRPFSIDSLIEKTEIVTAYTVEIWWMDISNLNFQGRAVPMKAGFRLCVNKNLKEVSRKFVTTHEVGHILHSFLYKEGSPEQRRFIVGNSRYSSLEEEICDYIAMRILCPIEQVSSWIRSHTSMIEGQILFAVADYFKVPVKEMALWIKQIATGTTIGLTNRINSSNNTSALSTKECIIKIAQTA